MFLFDRGLSLYVIDYINATKMLRDRNELTQSRSQNEELVKKLMQQFDEIRDVYDDEVPEHLRAFKTEYERYYSETDLELRELLKEKRGRIVAKSGIIYGDTELRVSRDDMHGFPTLDFQGDIPYLEQAMGVKVEGPLSGHKDICVLGSYNQIKRLPEHFDIEYLGEQSFGRQTYHLYRTNGVDNFAHPTFDGSIPSGAPLIERLPKLREEVLIGLKYLKDLEALNQDSSLSSLDIPEDERNDKYKNGRTLMMSALTLGIMDEMREIYSRAIDESRSLGDQVLSHELWYLTNVENEAQHAYSVTSTYDELKELGVPQLLAVQNTPISKIQPSDDAYAALIIKWSNRFVHHMSYRAWKVPVDSPESAVLEIRKELADIINEKGYTDRMFWLTEHALTNILGITNQVQMRRYS